MAVETDTERAIFFDSDDFASSATFTDVSAGTSSTIKGIFDKESIEQAVGEAGIIEEVPITASIINPEGQTILFSATEILNVGNLFVSNFVKKMTFL